LLVWLLSLTRAQTAQAGPADRESLSLNGVWEFYPEGKDKKHEIRVPSFWDAPQDYGYPAEWSHLQHGVYRKEIRLPASMNGKEIFLDIRRVSVIAKVWVNGQPVGAEDTGGYLMMQLPYLIDITPCLQAQQPLRLEIAVWAGRSASFDEDNREALIKDHDFPDDAMSDGRLLFPWCVDRWDGRRGLNGDVSLVAYPKVHVADVWLSPELHKNCEPQDDEITLRLTLANRDSRPRKIQVRNQASLQGSATTKIFEPQTVVLPPGASIDLTLPNVPWTNAVYWWPHDPRLYVLETTLWENGQTVDTCRTRFGFRQFYAKGNHYELNGVRINLRGDAYEFSWHEDYLHGPSTAPVFSTKELMPEFQKRLVREYQQLNHNVLRVHKTSNIDELYDTCDEIGMLVIDEAPFWQTWRRTDERAKSNFEAWVRRWIAARRNHPSIIAWGAANECWFGPIGMYSVQAARSMDPTRPVFQDDPWGQGQRHEDPTEPYPGDEECHHYTGGYPFTPLNAEALYDIYQPNPAKPTGEGEAMYADGWPLMNADGTPSAKKSQPGEFGNPDMISQATWLRGVGRIVRAMRYAGLADARPYADWMYAFDPVEADVKPEWNDLSAPGIKPSVLHRPLLNVFGGPYPVVRYNGGRDYYRNSFAPVAVFDKEAVRQARIGAVPLIFKPMDALQRTLVVYNDDLAGSNDILTGWSVWAFDPAAHSNRMLTEGKLKLTVPCGEKRETQVRFHLPRKLEPGRWLELRLTASKSGCVRFCETNRLGAILVAPPPELALAPEIVDLGTIGAADAQQWHTVRLTNPGGGQSELWKLTGPDDGVRFNLTAGNLRSEQEIYFQVKRDRLGPGDYRREFQVTSQSGHSAILTVKFTLPP